MKSRDPSELSDDDLGPLPTELDLKSVCESIITEINTFRSLSGLDDPKFRSCCDSLHGHVTSLGRLEGLPHFSDVVLASGLPKVFSDLVKFPDTKTSSAFISILTDMAEDVSAIDAIIRTNCIIEAVGTCLSLNERQIQSDAQFLYNTLDLISTILDGSEDAKDFADAILHQTKVLEVCQKQLARDDFDENIVACTETLAVLLQLRPNAIPNLEPAMLNMLLRFCANSRNPKTPSEDEAIHNAFNCIMLIAMDQVGNSMLQEFKAVELLLNGWSSSSKTSILCVRAIESCCSGSVTFCTEFVVAGGLKKLFRAFSAAVSGEKLCFAILGILESLLVFLDVESIHFKRVIRKFVESNCEKVSSFIKICDFVVGLQDENTNDEEDDKFVALTMCCCVVCIVLSYAPDTVRIAILNAISASDFVDVEVVIECVGVRVDALPLAANRTSNGVKVLSVLRDDAENV
jgi:hypothetical protein